MTTAAPPVVDEAKLNAFVGRMLGDLGALTNAVLVHVGDQLGLYKALATSGATTSIALAKQTGTSSAWCASGCRRKLPRVTSPTTGGHRILAFAGASDGIRQRREPGFHRRFLRHRRGLFRCAEDRQCVQDRGADSPGTNTTAACSAAPSDYSVQSYNHHLVNEWLPALDGVVEKLQRGAIVADVGCGHGASTILMAKAFPNSKFYGYDYHPGLDRGGTTRPRRKRASAIESSSRLARPRISRRRVSISSASSIVCTTWAIQSARRVMSAKRWRRRHVDDRRAVRARQA